MNNTLFVDSSGLNKTVVSEGTSVAQTSVGPIDPPANVAYSPNSHGASVYIGGGSNRVKITASSDLSPGTGDFTLEMWLYFTAASPGFFFRAASHAGYRNVDGSVVWGHDSFTIYTMPAGSIPLNTWKHYCISRQSGTTRYFLDGALIHTVADSNNYSWSASTLYVGASDGNSMTGFVGGLKLTIGTATYTSAFTPDVVFTNTTNTKLLLKFNNIGVHDSATRSPIVMFGDCARSELQSKYGSSSIYFPGNTSSYLQVPAGANSMLDLGSSDFTIEFWFYTTLATRMALTAYSSDYSFGIDYHYNGTRNINIYASSNGGSWNMIHADGGGSGIGTISTNLNAWNHVAVTRQGDTFRSFVNGVLDRTITVAGSIYTTGRGFRLGLWGTGTMPFNGFIDDLRINKGVARYTSSFTPPTELPKY